MTRRVEEVGRTDGSPTPLRTVSTVDAIVDVLRQRILDGTIGPGEPLREVLYADEFGVARHSFRAATQHLIYDGLLRRTRNQGVHVPVLGAGDIADVFRLRAVLELEAARHAIATGCPRGAVRAVDDLGALGDDAPWREVVDRDMHFHRALIDAMRSARFARAYDAVQSEILLCLVQLRPHYQSPTQVAAEHRVLLSAIRSGDEPAVTRLWQAHLNDAAAHLISALPASGERGHR
jgi:DNA-binding GntR family transcriptional regulator